MVEIRQETWRSDACLSLANEFLQLRVTRYGGQIASLSGIQGPEALWQPQWTAARPDQADQRWGPAQEAPLLANICGWSLCLDRFGLRPDDQGRPLHGEAGALPWTLSPCPEEQAICAEVSLPLAQLHIRRLISLQGYELHVDTRLSSLDQQPHEVEWCEHIALGDPLLQGAQISAAAASATLHPDPAALASSRFPDILAGAQVPIAEALAMPGADAAPAGDIVALALEQGGWQVYNPQLGWQLSCDFAVEDFPWLCLWTEHQARQSLPWQGQTRVRGMEASTKPFPEGLPPADRYPQWQGRSTRCLVPADQPLQRHIQLRWQPSTESDR